MINTTVLGTTVKNETCIKSLLAGELSNLDPFSYTFRSSSAFQTVRLAKGLFCSLLQAPDGYTNGSGHLRRNNNHSLFDRGSLSVTSTWTAKTELVVILMMRWSAPSNTWEITDPDKLIIVVSGLKTKHLFMVMNVTALRIN